MNAVVLEKPGTIAIRDMPVQGAMGPDMVRIRISHVGICGSDVHYFTHGRIGPFVVEQPMILGHEASGVVIETGCDVAHLAPGNRVCMEPGVPNPRSRAVRIGKYNLDPDITFWATPPVHGCLIEEVIHPAEFTFRLPDSVSLAEGAMVEPLAIGMHAATKASVKPGDAAVVLGAGTIGIMCSLSLLAAGCSTVYITDSKAEKLAIAGSYDNIIPIDITANDPVARVMADTDGWGADLVVEASGSAAVYPSLIDYLCPGGRAVLVGHPSGNAPMDISRMQSREIEISTIFRYANMYPRAIALLASGAVDVARLISATYPFFDSIAAFERAARLEPDVVKIQIELPA